MIDTSRYTDEQYLKHDPFAGDRDVNYRCRSAKIVKVRKPRFCPDCKQERPIGTRMRADKAVVDGQWHTAYTCLECIARWFDEEPSAVPRRWS